MFKFKILISAGIFSLLLIGTSIIKNQTRELEKNIYNLNKIVNQKEKDLNESELDFSYLSSPLIIEKKVKNLDNFEYFPMDYSKIFLNISSFLKLQNKYVINKN